MLSKNQLAEIRLLHTKKGRDQAQRFIAEGLKTVEELIRLRPDLVVAIYGTSLFTDQDRAVLRKKDIPFYETKDEQMEKMSLQHTPSGALAVCRYIDEHDADFNPQSELALYLDDIRDPGNMGTILRLADWFGVKKVFCSHNTCELYNPKVVQSSMGAFLRVEVVYDQLEKIISRCGVDRVYGAVLNGNDVYREELKNGLLVIGNESNGIQVENLALINKGLTIPAHQNNGTESLNAAMATAILCSEFFRQLRQA